MNPPSVQVCLDENQALDYVEGRLGRAEADTVDDHLEACPTCRQFVGEVARFCPGGLPPPSPKVSEVGNRVGRYVLLGPLGAGGMGIVYSAFDPQLDRKVALKLPRHPSPIGRQRLVAEAQALAQLQHPNVVAVYDVGVDGEQVFIAMEHVEGQTLDVWLGKRARSWRAVLDVFARAGRGLASAHRAGLVHRDFKPHNVMIDAAGRVRVLDFGLAMQAGPRSTTTSPGRGPSDSPALTETGALIGTPAYMAPEQHEGRSATAKSDQFAYCVALYEALYGRRPFAGDALPDLTANVTAGRLRPPPRDAKVPSRVFRALRRGLSVDPGERFSSIDELLAQLEPRAGLRQGVVVALGLAAALVLIAFAGRGQGAQLCQGSGERLAHTWNDARRQRIESVFLATGAPYADEAWAEADRAFEAYADSWVTMHEEACAATRISGRQSDELLSLRMICLDRKLRSLDALATVFESADVEVIADAAAAAAKLPPVDACADVEALAERLPAPDTEDERRRLERVDEAVAKAAALSSAGKVTEALGAANAAEAAARALGYAPALAEALQAVANAQTDAGNFEAAERTFSEAIWAADAGHHDFIKAECWANLVFVISRSPNRIGEARAAARHAEAAISRYGANNTRFDAMLHLNLGLALTAAGEFAEARREIEQALRIHVDQLDPTSINVALADNALGNVLLSLAAYDDALTHFESALAITVEMLGRQHPLTAAILDNIGNAYWYNADLERALATKSDALALREAMFEPDNPDIANSLNNVGVVLEELGRPDEARGHYQRALDIYQRAYGDENHEVAKQLSNLGNIAFLSGARDEAEDLWLRSLAMSETTLGAEHPDLVQTLDNLAMIARAGGAPQTALKRHQRSLAINRATYGEGSLAEANSLVDIATDYSEMQRCDEAVPQFDRAWLIIDAALRPDHPDRLYALAGRGSCLLELGRGADSLVDLERALVLIRDNDHDRSNVAQVMFMVAKARWAVGQDRAGAVDIARNARDELRAVLESRADAATREQLDEVVGWLRKGGRSKVAD